MAKRKVGFFIGCLVLLAAAGVFLGVNFESRYIYVNEEISQTENIDIFENYTQTSLKEEYKNIDVLDQLKASQQIDEQQYDRALDVLKGNVKFAQRREFSTEFENDNKIDQVGDIARYSQTELKCIWPASELILTGIYGMQEETFNIFVEADTDKLPSILFSQNHGYYSHWYEERQLKNGLNKIEFPSFGRGLVADDEIWGGAIYICNPYFPYEQGKVNLYIEGGGYYPVFRKGGNENEFLNFLEEYENERKSKRMLDMAELVTDHAIITTTSSSLYDVYFNNNVITPSENLNLWGNYITQLFEFNGIPTSDKSNVGRPYDPRNDYVKINFRYMTYYQGSGAYSFSYHIGWYYEHYWFANFYNAMHPLSGHVLDEHLIFGIGHELGHALDNEPRKINETTNNFTAAMAYFNIVGKPHHNQYQPFEKTLKALSNDYILDYYAYDDGQIMYTKQDYPTNYDHNYLIWWDLEAVFPGFWAKFNNYFRGTLETDLSMEEKFVYYSSLATGVDLSNYYERWGFYYGKSPKERSHRFIYSSSSTKFKNLMQQALNSGEISKKYDHFWYVDGTQYNFALSHQNVLEENKLYKGETPSITKILKSNNKRTIYIQGERDEAHLGYEIMSKVDGVWKLAGFTYGSSFVDGNYYSQNPTYKVVAINRYFYTSDESEEYSTVSTESPSVCRIGGQYFDTLHHAYETATSGQTIYLLADCKLEFTHLLKDITIEIDPTVLNDILIDTNGTYFQIQSDFTIKGRKEAKIIFDGNQKQSSNPLIYAVSSNFKAENVVFRNMQTVYLAGVVYAPGANIQLLNCSFENCVDLKADGIIHASKEVKLENCTFSQIEEPCVNINNLDNLTLSQNVDEISIVFGNFDDTKNIKLEGNFTRDVLDKIEINPDYMLKFEGDRIAVSKLLYNLKFYGNGENFDFDVNSHEFEFGTEQHEYNLTDTLYVEYEERVSGKKYKTGDKIYIDDDMEFNFEIKNKFSLKIFYNNAQSLNYYANGEEIYLPTIDSQNNRVFAYKDGDRIYDAGKVYTIKADSTLVAVYLGNLTYRYIVKDEIYSVGYGNYGQTIQLLELKEEGFLGWKSDVQIVLNSAILNDDVDFIAVFDGELPKTYELDKCEIQVVGTYTYSGSDIQPQIIVYFNGFIVPENYYSISYSNNISASTQAQVSINYVDGLSTGSKTQFFTILPRKLSLSDVNVTGLEDVVYNGSETSQNLTFSFNDKNIETFFIEYVGDRTNAGKVQIKVTFSGNFLGEISLEYTILKANRDGFGVSLDDWVYDDVTFPNPQVQNTQEQAAITYTYSKSQYGNYSNERPKNAGNYWIKATIADSKNYKSAEATSPFTIEKADQPKIMPESAMTVSRKAKTLQEIKLISGWEWENSNTKIDDESIQANAVYFDKLNYKNYQIEITITKQLPKEATALEVYLEQVDFVYDGNLKMPKVVAKDGSVTLALGEDFDVEYKNNKLAGQGEAVVTFTNDYTGTITLVFTISNAPATEQNNLLWLAIVVPVAALILVCAGFAIARYRRKKWWENK